MTPLCMKVNNRWKKSLMNSKLFKALQKKGILMDDHEGGCVLYEKKHEVERLCGK